MKFNNRVDPVTEATTFLSLTLFVLLRGTDHKNFAMTADDLAVVATLLNGGAYFHCLFPKLKITS